MGDGDFDELDGPTRPQPRKGKFLPKASKIKSEPKAESTNPKPEPQPEPESKPSLIVNTDVTNAVEMDVDPKAVDDVVKESAVVEEEEEDSVVREIDVYFNPLDDSATQYPLRPRWRPYELEERCEEVRFKPTSSEVEIDLSIDFDSKNYDANGYHITTTTKQTFSTLMKPLGGAKGIAVGMLTGNKLHINPIRAAVQLRPLRKPDVSTAPNNKHDAVKSEDIKDEKSPGPSRKLLPERPNRTDENVEEDWIPLNHHSANSELSARYLEKMSATESSPIQFSVSLNNYINSMCPGANKNNKTKGLNVRDLHSLPLEERFVTWFREHPCANRFVTLKHLAPEDSIEDFFAALQRVACLVQGLWVPKSTVLFDKGLERLAWDYVLLLFSKSLTISHRHVNSIRQTERNAIEGVLSILANNRKGRVFEDWKFKVAPDMTFVKQYPKIVIEQELNWKLKGEGIPKLSKETDKALKTELATNPGTQRASSSNAAVGSSNGVVSKAMSSETLEALPKLLLKIFQTHKVCSFQQIRDSLREMALSDSSRPKAVSKETVTAAEALDCSQEELMEIINQVATNVHGVYVLKKSQDDQQLNPLRKVVIDLLIAEGPKGKLKKANILAAAKVELKRDIPDSEYNKVLKELCVTHGGGWVLKGGDGNPILK